MGTLLVVLSFALPVGASSLSISPTAYDKQMDVSVTYDGASSSTFNYDSTFAISANEKANETRTDTTFGHFPEFFAAEGTVTLDANAIRFSQSNVRSSLPELTESMKANGWQGSPIDVVRMSDGSLTAVDNTRLAAASLSKTPVQAIIRGFDEVFPATRAGGNLQGGTWGEAVLNRIGGQKPGWQRLYPNGSPFTGVHPTTPGFSP